MTNATCKERSESIDCRNKRSKQIRGNVFDQANSTLDRLTHTVVNSPWSTACLKSFDRSLQGKNQNQSDEGITLSLIQFSPFDQTNQRASAQTQIMNTNFFREKHNLNCRSVITHLNHTHTIWGTFWWQTARKSESIDCRTKRSNKCSNAGLNGNVSRECTRSIEQIQHTITQINYQLTLIGQLVLLRTFNKSFTARKETESIDGTNKHSKARLKSKAIKCSRDFSTKSNSSLQLKERSLTISQSTYLDRSTCFVEDL